MPLFMLALLLASAPLIPPAAADTAVSTVSAGSSPGAVAVNQATDKIYVANQGSGTVTVIDGVYNDDAHTATVNVGSSPDAIAINPATDKIYVANSGNGAVTVVDGVYNDDAHTSTVSVGSSPDAIAVNPVTDMIYIANSSSDNVTVIDGVSNAVYATVNVGLDSYAIAINPVTDKIYVVGYYDANNIVTVIDGASNTVTATVTAGSGTCAVAVDPVTDRIYAANYDSGSVTVIDGVTDTVYATVTGIPGVWVIAVNPDTDKIYAVAWSTGDVTVIDGASNSATTINGPGDAHSVDIAVNPATDKIYVDNQGQYSVTVIDGAYNDEDHTVTVDVGSSPVGVAVNPVTDEIYVTNSGGNNVTVIDGDFSAATVSISPEYDPWVIAVNPVTDKIYTANWNNGDVTAIDGATDAVDTSIVGPGTGAHSVDIAVNPATDKIYVANQDYSNVTVIDGASNTASFVNTGYNSGPVAVAVNTTTDMIYVANQYYGTVTVIDGADNTVAATVSVGSSPDAIAVNQATDEIYVTNSGGNSVTVIDGVYNDDAHTATVSVGSSPDAIAVNQATDEIYVTNSGNGTVTVIDGADNSTATVSVGSSPDAIAVNQATDEIYVTNYGSGTVTVIDGADNSTTTVSVGVGSHPDTIAIDPATDKIYVVDYYEPSNSVTVIDGTSNAIVATVETLPGWEYPETCAIAVNPTTGKAYAANYNNNSVTVITEVTPQTVPVTASINPLSGNLTTSSGPSFSISASSSTEPVQQVVVWCQLDGITGSWAQATYVSSTSGIGSYSFTASGLSPGEHTLYIFAADGQDATSDNVNNESGSCSSLLISQIASYSFVYYVPAPASITATAGDNQSAEVGEAFAVPLQATVKDSVGNTFSGATVAFTAPGTGAGGTFANGTATDTETTDPNGVATASAFTANTTAGSYVVTASVSGVSTTASFNLTNTPKDTDATLSDLEVNGATVAGFDAGTLTYSVVLPAGTTTVPTVTATVYDTGKATEAITQAASVTGTATVLVTAQDTSVSQTYTINFTVAAPGPVTVASVTNPSNITVANGTALANLGLPTTVGITLSDDTSPTVGVTWDGGNPTYDGSVAGNYTFTGTLILLNGVTNPLGLTASVTATVQQAAPVLLTPVVTPDGGAISSTQQITITDPNGIPGDSVYYTLDGSMPTMQNNLYTGPFTLDNSATVAAAVYNPTPGWSSPGRVTFTVTATLNNNANQNHDVSANVPGVPVTTIVVPSTESSATIETGNLLGLPSNGTVTTAPLPPLDIQVSTTLSSSPVQVAIPAGTTVSAPAGWNGAISLPTVEATSSVTVPTSGNTINTVNAVVEIGAGDTELTFSRAVRLVIPGMAGKSAGYVRGGTFYAILALDNAQDSQTWADANLPDGGDVKIDAGNDLVIWTKHFTEFVAYTETSYAPGGPAAFSPAVQTVAATGITANSAALNGEIISDDNSNITEYGFLWGTGPQSLTNTLTVGTDNHSGAFTDTLGSLTAGTAYYFQAYAKNAMGESLGAVLSFTAGAPQAPPKSNTPVFTDVPATYWAYGAITNLSGLGYVSGYPDGTFRPGSRITRTEFVTIMDKVLKLTPYTTQTPMFSDVKPDDWFYRGVETAVYAGIAKGYGNTFKPDDPITREEISAILVNALGKRDEAMASMNERTSFADDTNISSWARGFVVVAVKYGLLNGYPDGSFGPQGSATRAEACAMIENFLNSRK
jgi:YVTN family beta-propeller protein